MTNSAIQAGTFYIPK